MNCRKINTLATITLLLLFSCSTSKSVVSISEKTYDEVWSACNGALNDSLVLLEQDPDKGVLKAESSDGKERVIVVISPTAEVMNYSIIVKGEHQRSIVIASIRKRLGM